MTRPSIILSLLIVLRLSATAQKPVTYTDSLHAFQNDYIDNHEVVKGKDKSYLHFFVIDSSYRVLCGFEKIDDKKGLMMISNSKVESRYFIYGKISFRIHDTLLHLFVYQSEQLLNMAEYKNDLFVPYTDATSGNESYGGGKYIDLVIADIKKSTLLLDFNKAYNPYCAYVEGYNCPLPPKENHLSLSVRAGEMAYGKPH
jgi:uncharacterized protein (DUF1684 family)